MAIHSVEVRGGQEAASADAVTEASFRRVTLAMLVTGLLSVTLGLVFGPIQALNYAGVNIDAYLEPLLKSYYQGLTLHGVMNAYAFTTFFMSGMMLYLTRRELKLLPNVSLSWIGYFVMLLGLLLTLLAIFSNTSTVLYTFYAPMMAHWSFYLGIGLIFTGSWLFSWQIYELIRRYKGAHPHEVTPLVSWMSLITMSMWFLASLGAVIAIVFLQFPWSVGWLSGVDPLLTRTLFWWTGHPIVYFWLLPAYISWYALVPRQAGGNLVSDPMARLAFILLLVFSLPVGTHHQLEDAGINDVIRGLVVFMTFVVIVPSLITAFTVGASLEDAGRRRGGRGWFGWIRKLPWSDPSISAQLFAMLMFIIGGASGLVNASWLLNGVIHNTTWVPGHFHATLASASALTFFGISYWLLPHLTGRALFAPKAALAGNWFWFIGMLLFANGMMSAGLMGVPRRAWVSGMLPGRYGEVYGHAAVPLFIVGLGGVLLAVAIVFILISIYGTLFNPHKLETIPEVPFAYALAGPGESRLARLADRFWFWFILAAALLLAVYIPLLWHMLLEAVPLSPLRRW